MVSSQQVAKISINTSNNDNSSSSNTRRKIEIKRVEESSKRHVTFSKRKQGLFNKVTELSILCQAETALIVKSQNGKLYSCGYPAPDTVIRRFLNPLSTKHARAEKNKQKDHTETLRIQFEATQEILKKEKKRRDEAEANKALMGFPCWWNYSIDEMGLEELEQFKASLEQLKINLMATMEDKRVNSVQFQPMIMPFPSMLPMQNKYSNFTPILNNGGLSVKQEQEAWSLRNNSIVSSNNNSYSGTWDLGDNVIANSNHSYLHPNVDFGHYYHN